ncbi:MAG TPA: hypothetical protein DC053_22135 [Lachnoclostridium sp.]|nr:hypothetical protein [Lachnoclostridium sp.]
MEENQFNPYPQYNSVGYNGALSSQPPKAPPYSAYEYKARVDFEKEANLIQMKAFTEIDKHKEKRAIDEENFEELLRVKTDLQIKRDMLSETIMITDQGMLRRTQEFMLEANKEYYFANFSIPIQPVQFKSAGIDYTVLCMRTRIERLGEKDLYFDLRKDDANYYRRKFRNAGIIFKKKRREGDEFFFDVIQAVIGISRTVEVPGAYGFYTVEGMLQYADKKTMLWKEVLDYAK